MADLDDAAARALLLQLGEVFTPSAPVDDQDLFAGRNHELFSVVEAMQSVGQHASSLVNAASARPASRELQAG